MKATEQLRKEHDAVKTVLKAMEKISAQLAAKEKINPPDLEHIVDFLKVFVDRCHHAKEENMLFVALAEDPDAAYRISALLTDHAQGRQFIRDMTLDIDKYKAGHTEVASKLSKDIKNYITLLIQHMDIEDNILFPMADKHLNSQKHTDLLSQFDRLEEEEIGAGKHEEYHRFIDRLKSTYL